MEHETIPIYPDFKNFSLKDRNLIQGFLDQYQPVSCEYSFFNLFCWQKEYNFCFCIYKDRLLILDKKGNYFLMPLGKSLAPKELAELSQNMKQIGKACDIALVPHEYLIGNPQIKKYYQEAPQKNSEEYIYLVKKLADLKGKKLQKKKNLISQFKKKYPGFCITKIQGPLIKKSLVLAQNILSTSKGPIESLQMEYAALKQALGIIDRSLMDGLAITVEGKLAAFSIFSRLTPSTYDIHFEKSDLSFKGSAQVINHETAKYLKDECEYLNREQDLGIKGLRQAKLSWDPHILFKPFLLTFIQ
jgi:uncharacterized protein